MLQNNEKSAEVLKAVYLNIEHPKVAWKLKP